MATHTPEQPSAHGEASPEELIDFVGPQAERYLQQWRRQAGPSFHWAAFLFGPFWLGFRKMYRTLAAYVALGVGLSLVEAVIAERVLGLPRLPVIAQQLTSVALALALGLSAYHWYLREADRRIQRLRATGLSGPAWRELLRRAGGTSWMSMVVAALVAVAIGALTFGAAALALGLHVQ